jgi:hypothetical protein
MFGDNKSVVNSTTTPHAKLHKRHNALSFHGVRVAIAGKFVAFHWIDGSLNPADILGKHWGHQAIWPLLQALLFWEGDTVDLFDHQKCKQAEHQSKPGLNGTEQSNLAKAEKGQTSSLRRMLCGAVCPSSQGTIVTLFVVHCLCFGNVGWSLMTTIIAQDQLPAWP